MNADASLPRVDFYHLSGRQPHALRLFCARLSEKAWHLGYRIFILGNDADDCQQLDRALWIYRDTGFLPHALYGSAEAADSPILIGSSFSPDTDFDLLINLNTGALAQIEHFTPRCRRIAEIIDQNPNTKQAGRLRYSYYDKNNYPLEYHEITASH